LFPFHSLHHVSGPPQTRFFVFFPSIFFLWRTPLHSFPCPFHPQFPFFPPSRGISRRPSLKFSLSTFSIPFPVPLLRATPCFLLPQQKESSQQNTGRVPLVFPPCFLTTCPPYAIPPTFLLNMIVLCLLHSPLPPVCPHL